MPPTPDDEDGPDEQDPSGPSLFEELLADAVGPMTVHLAEQDWTVPPPSADEVAALDDCADAEDILDELLGEELADPVLELLDDLPSYVTDDLAEQVLLHFHLLDPPPGGWAELVRRIDRYGPAIEADLPHEWPGIELEQWFRGERRWPQLYRLIEQLPPGSRWSAAVLLDKEAAQAQIDAEAELDEEPDEDDDPRPPLLGETYERKLQRAMVSALLRIEHGIYAVNAPRGRGGNPPRPLKGPRTARDELLRDDGLDEVYAMFAAVDPEWRHPDEVGREDPPSGYRETASGLVVPD